MYSIDIGNKKCNIYINGNEAPVFVYINEPSIPVGATQIIESLKKINKNNNYIFIEILIDNWDKNLSPWKIETNNNRNFTGDGIQTLNFLLDDFIPYINNNFKEHQEIYLTGYSLSGLFALWALYETDVFDGIASCSGSLWFPGWEKYMLNKNLNNHCFVYLSLGGKEERPKNSLMSSVGENTRNQFKILKNNHFIKSVTLEMNPGGHFSNTAMRVAKGINWILKERINFKKRLQP